MRSNKIAIEVPPTERIIGAVLGDEFVEIEPLRYGAAHSGHGVMFGYYSNNGEDFLRVAVKPYWGRKAVGNANRENMMTKRLAKKGFSTLRPLGVIALTENRDPNDHYAVFMTEYEGMYHNASTLTVEEDPDTEKGKMVSAAVGHIITTLAQLHNEGVTHGDSQLKNYMLHKYGELEYPPLVIDLEKTNTHGSKRNPGMITYPKIFFNGICNDLIRLSFSLGSRQYGGDRRDYFTETVVEPYMSTLDNSIKAGHDFVPAIARAVKNFDSTKIAYSTTRHP